MLARLQAKASLLLAIFLSAGTTLPSLDALAYHGAAPEETRSGSHIESAGGCVSHSGHCALGRSAPGSGAGLLENPERRLDTTTSAPQVPPQSLTRLGNAPLGVPQPRAPPVLFA